MELRAIERNENKDIKLYESAECQRLIDTMNEYYLEIGFKLPWIGYFAIKNNQVVGTGGFTGEPVNGKVEIAYWTFKQFENQGVASFVCKSLIDLAKNSFPAVIITAKTAPEYNASTKILQKNGFVLEEIVEDHEIGEAWLWKHLQA
jgi:[ribosomal protein S5]-alanine N-acetyltransferase